MTRTKTLRGLCLLSLAIILVWVLTSFVPPVPLVSPEVAAGVQDCAMTGVDAEVQERTSAVDPARIHTRPQSVPDLVPMRGRDLTVSRSPTTAAMAASIRVIVSVDPNVVECTLPEPELLRLDENDMAWPVKSTLRSRHPLAHLRSSPAGDKDGVARGGVVSHTFQIQVPGRYVAAWHAWVRVPGTLTYRVVRGRGPELWVDGGGGVHELVVKVHAGDLVIPEALDRRDPNAKYRITAKDGD